MLIAQCNVLIYLGTRLSKGENNRFNISVFLGRLLSNVFNGVPILARSAFSVQK